MLSADTQDLEYKDLLLLAVLADGPEIRRAVDLELDRRARHQHPASSWSSACTERAAPAAALSLVAD